MYRKTRICPLLLLLLVVVLLQYLQSLMEATIFNIMDFHKFWKLKPVGIIVASYYLFVKRFYQYNAYSIHQIIRLKN